MDLRSLNKEIHGTMGHLSKLLEAFRREELFIQRVITVELYAWRIHYYLSLCLPLVLTVRLERD